MKMVFCVRRSLSTLGLSLGNADTGAAVGVRPLGCPSSKWAIRLHLLLRMTQNAAIAAGGKREREREGGGRGREEIARCRSPTLVLPEYKVKGGRNSGNRNL